ncbi:MAG TPA: hypothetical protein VG474_12520 [Solirubrobacteraceae bacterium]|nr:hypothetical protein [Solirubrobacteraceae bacterium]
MSRARSSAPAFAAAVAAAAAVLALAAPAAAQQPPTAFAADASEAGVISLLFWGAGGGPVRYFERVGDRRERLGRAQAAPGAVTTLRHATTWSCDRLVRRFEARATLPGGAVASATYGVRTPSCRERFELRAPRRVAPGARVRVRIVDRWSIGGIRTRLCVAPPRAERACRTVRFPRAVAVATRRFRATTEGRWRVELRVRRHRVRRYVAVGGETRLRDVAPPTVLATGDSTIQGIDSFLGDELGEAASVRSDVQIGSAISRGDFWVGHAASQTRRLRQRVSVISVGAAFDGFPLPGPGGQEVECCDAPWMLAYSARVRAIMRTYLRGGRGRVFWLTPPLPRDPVRARITTAIGAAIRHAAEGLPGATVVRIDRIFSPGGAYREVIRYRGRDVRVRDADGVHLNVSGTAIVAQLLAPAIRDALERAR